jgi:hypothetical protein
MFISDVVKIGLPLLLGGGLTLFTFRITRRHNERVDRRKRLQDALEALARALARWEEASEDHYLYRRDSYFKCREPTQTWYEGSLETIDRMKRCATEVQELHSLLTVNGIDFAREIAEVYRAHNAVKRALQEAGKNEEQIASVEGGTTTAYRCFLKRIQEMYAKL